MARDLLLGEGVALPTGFIPFAARTRKRGTEVAQRMSGNENLDAMARVMRSSARPGRAARARTRRTCAWCGDQAVDTDTEVDVRISHTICAGCLENQLRALCLPVPEAA